MNWKRQRRPPSMTSPEALVKHREWKEMIWQEAYMLETVRNVPLMWQTYVGRGLPCVHCGQMIAAWEKRSWRTLKVCEVQVITHLMPPEKFCNSPWHQSWQHVNLYQLLWDEGGCLKGGCPLNTPWQRQGTHYRQLASALHGLIPDKIYNVCVCVCVCVWIAWLLPHPPTKYNNAEMIRKRVCFAFYLACHWVYVHDTMLRGPSPIRIITRPFCISLVLLLSSKAVEWK